MTLSIFKNDKVAILKKNGTRIDGLQANVQHNKIFMTADDLLIEPEDLIQRSMSNGVEETYRVIDPGFYEAFHGIPANYQMEVQKLGIPEAKQAIQSITYNITGNNARVNHASVDNSTNVVNNHSDVLQHIKALRAEIRQLEMLQDDKDSAIEVINTVEEQFKSGNPKKSVVSALLNSLPSIDNITSIVAAIMGIL